jgi:hypothetical protein
MSSETEKEEPHFLEFIGKELGEEILKIDKTYPDVLTKQDIRDVIDSIYDFGEYDLKINHNGITLSIDLIFEDPNAAQQIMMKREQEKRAAANAG